MDMTLLKVIITYFVCELIRSSTCVPLREDQFVDHSIKKRSPAEFSLFGIGTPHSIAVNPIQMAQKTFNKFSNLFTPAVNTQNENRHQFYVSMETVHTTNGFNSNRGIQNKPTQIEYVNNRKENIPSSVYLPGLPTTTSAQNIVLNNNQTYTEQDPKSTHLVNEVEKNNDILNQSNTNEKQEAPMKIDKAIIDEIFKDVKENVIDSTTEDTTMDYTTETGDYESTTTDELLRIPAPVVASLLG